MYPTTTADLRPPPSRGEGPYHLRPGATEDTEPNHERLGLHRRRHSRPVDLHRGSLDEHPPCPGQELGNWRPAHSPADLAARRPVHRGLAHPAAATRPAR